MSDSIKVAIKVRPLIKRERDDNLPVQWEVQGEAIYSVDPETKRRGEYYHVFDHIFGMDKNNSDIFDIAVKPIVEAAVNGFNGTIFAYGQTSSGKTYTMMGTQEESGIIPLAIESIFDTIANASGREFLLRVSYLEIYNEKVNDLLHKNGTDLKIHEDINGQVIVKCKEEVTNCPQNVLSIMKKGDKNRRIGETNMNERSSRSHTIFRITIESREAGSDANGAIQVSQLNLVDLAGSERARQTGATGDRFKEGRHINLSLSSLSLVIMQLSESKEHVNFRDSKLTRILQASLGGNAMTTIICAVTPATLEETQCTLAFASRAKRIKNKPQINEVVSDAALLKRYSKLIAKLNAELEQERQANRCAEVEEMESKLQEKDDYIQFIEDRMELLKTRIVSGANLVENVDFKTKARRRRTWGGPSISSFQNQSMILPTIQESASIENTPADWKRSQYKKRQSILRAPLNDIVNEAAEFQTAVEDFELELMESERNWEMGRFSSDSVDLEDNYYISKRKTGEKHIRFNEDVINENMLKINSNESPADSPEKAELLTPPRRHDEQDFGTPKEVLRERITHLMDEYTTLQEFTTLEKQLYATERVEPKDHPDSMGPILNHMKKSVADSEMMCLETNKKYSDLYDKYLELEVKYDATLQENEILKKKVETFSGIEENFRLIELENNQLKKDMEAKLQRLKKLDEERNDYEFQIELLESKHKTREKELETSLQSAWSATRDNEELSSVIHLQSLVNDLTKEVETLTNKLEDTKILQEHPPLLTEYETMKKQLEEYDKTLKNEQDEKRKLMEELEALKKTLEHKPFSHQDTSSDKHDEVLDLSEKNTVATTTTLDSDLNVKPIINAQPDEINVKAKVPAAFGQSLIEKLHLEINKKSAIISKLQELLHIGSKEHNLKPNLESSETKDAQQKLEITSLQECVAELINMDNIISNEYNDVVSKLEEMNLDREAIFTENIELKSKLSLNSDELKSNVILIDSLQIDMDELKLKLDEKNSALSNMKFKFDELQQIRAQVESCLEKSITDNNSKGISTLEKELQAQTNELNLKLQEIELNKLEMINLNNEIVKKSNEISRLNGIIEKLSNQNEYSYLMHEKPSKDSNEKIPAVVSLQNGTATTESIIDQTLNSVQLEVEDNCSNEIEPSNKVEKHNIESGEYDATNSSTQVSQNLLLQKDENEFSNGESVTIMTELCKETNVLLDSFKQIEEPQNIPTIDTTKENVDGFKVELDKLIVENENLMKENNILKSQIQTFVEQTMELKTIAEKIHHVEKDLEVSHAIRADLEKYLTERETKIKELQSDIDKLKNQIVNIKSEKTSWEREKCAMQKVINENTVIIEQVPKLEANIKDLKLINEELEQMILELRTNLNAKCLELESIEVHKFESEIQNLKCYVANLEQFNKNIQIENKDLKNQLCDQSSNLKTDFDNLTQKNPEQEKMAHVVEDEKNLTENIANLSKVKFEQILPIKSDVVNESECEKEELSQDTKQHSSIFANATYFDEMDVSIGENSTLLDESTGNISLSKDDTESSAVTTLKKRIQELEDCNRNLEKMNKEYNIKLEPMKDDETVNKLYELMDIKTLLEEENAKISTELQLKIQESAEIKNDVQGLRLGIEKLEQTIHLLTTENIEMSNKLSVEKDRAREADTACQSQIEDLYCRISKVTEEKLNLESELKMYREELETLRANTPIGTEDEVREKIQEYQEKIDSLTTENISLSTNLMETMKELDEIKESKALLYDHECSYKDQVQELTEKLETFNQENIELSSNLMEKIEEWDSLKHAYELLENKLAVAVTNQLSTSINISQNEIFELRAQNCQLKSENIDLVAKVSTLSNENTKFSDNLLEAITALEDSRLNQDESTAVDNLLSKSMNLSRSSSNVCALDDNPATDDGIQTLKNKVEAYKLQVSQLTRLNKKLSDLKLSSCAQCTHLKELNDSRRTLKLEVRSLNHKLRDLQTKFERKCADTEVLRNKACEELNLSTMSDVALNGSISECMNVSFVEEKIQSLNNELTTLKQNHEKLSSLYKNKCSEIERFNESSALEDSLSVTQPDPPASNNNRARIERVQEDIDKLREEIQSLKKRNTTLSESLHKFINEKSHLQAEINTLKVSKEELNTKLKEAELKIEVAHEKVSIFENEVTDLNKLVESLRTIEREAKNDKLNFEVEIEVLKTEKITNSEALDELKNLLRSEKENNAVLQKNLETLLEEAEELKKKNSFVLESMKEQSISQLDRKAADDQFRNTIDDLNYKMAKLLEENTSLIKQIETLQQNSVVTETDLSPDYNKVKEELNNAKKYITKEIRSLKPKIELVTLSNKTVDELLVEFIKIIMMKEQEIIKTVQDRFEQEKQSLEDAKRQSVDAERRVTTWAQELEADIEKLQADLTNQDNTNSKLKHEIEKLENDLKESIYEKQLLKEKIEVLESDFNGLQAELAKQSDDDNKQGRELNAVHERERIALASAQNRETELQNSIKSMKDQYNKKIEELTFTLEHYKTKNLELKSNLEGLEANERQLKSIIDVKSMDLARLQQRLTVLERETTQMSEACSQLNQENENKNQRIEEITNLLKMKCDKLSEYKVKLDSIVPEYEILKEQTTERKQYAEKYKNEYEDLREKTTKELNLIKDKLSDEQMKSSSLNDQLTDLNNRNKVLLSEMEELKGRCEELERSNEKLVKKVRNSTSNSKVEAQIEDLKDQNVMLQKNVEGASNRITELQESKNLVTKDLISLQAKYEILAEEKKELEKIVEFNKTKISSSDLRLTKLHEKLEAQIQEKNKIALELEAKKLLVSQKEKDLIIAHKEIENLSLANKELNEELDDLAKEIQDRIADNVKLSNQISESKDNPKSVSDNLKMKIEATKEEHQKTKSLDFTTEAEILIDQNKKLHEEIEVIHKKADILRKENTELKAKVTDLELKLESRSCNSSRSSSPLLDNSRRKQRRSDLYNQGRSLEETQTCSDAVPVNCRCSSLTQKVHELELEIVSRNGKIATLEMQIQSENFPYQKKCKDLEENLWAFKNKNTILREEVKRLQRALSSTSASECEVCRRHQTNKRDQSTQCLPEHKTFLSGTSSGIVDDLAKIQKLEKEKALMRDLCRSRTRHIQELQRKISDYESILSERTKIEVTVPLDENRKNTSNENIKSLMNRDKLQILGENTKRAMKENLSSNILDNATGISSRRVKSTWSH